MSTGKGQVLEIILEDGSRHVRVACPPNLIPSPGQYLLAGDRSDSPLPVPLFYTDSVPEGGSMAPPLSAGPSAWRQFIAAASVPDSWNPGLELSLRGPLGRGFTLPLFARKVGLIALDASPARLRGLIRPALRQDAAVVLACDSSPDNLPDEVEVQPISLMSDVMDWADYLALAVPRGYLHEMRARWDPFRVRKDAQILVHTPVPCGGLAECGVCAVTLKSGWKLACKDGPVFDWRDFWE